MGSARWAASKIWRGLASVLVCTIIVHLSLFLVDDTQEFCHGTCDWNQYGNAYGHAYGHALGMYHAPFENSRRGGHFEYRHVYTRTVDRPSALPI